MTLTLVQMEVSYFKYINPPKDENGLYEWDKLIAWNRSDWDGDASSAIGDADYIADEYRSKAIIRASVNHHDWYGLISTFKYDEIVPNLNLTTGIDARSYKGIHYREVVNLLGGDYYVDSSDDNDVSNSDKVKRVGDKVAYHNIGYNSWIGGFVQGEYSINSLTAFLSAAGSNTTYQREISSITLMTLVNKSLRKPTTQVMHLKLVLTTMLIIILTFLVMQVYCQLLLILEVPI